MCMPSGRKQAAMQQYQMQQQQEQMAKQQALVEVQTRKAEERAAKAEETAAAKAAAAPPAPALTGDVGASPELGDAAGSRSTLNNKRKGRGSLRIDLSAGSSLGSGAGLNVPN